MKKLSMPLAREGRIGLEHELNFPESGDFRSKPCPVGLADITRLSEERLPFMNSSPESEEVRLAIKAKQMFVL